MIFVKKGRIVKITGVDGSVGFIVQTKWLWWWITYENSWLERPHVYETIAQARDVLNDLTKDRRTKKEVVEVKQ